MNNFRFTKILVVLAVISIQVTNSFTIAKADIIPRFRTNPIIVKIDRYPGSNSAVLHWLAPQDDGGSPITGYSSMVVAPTTTTPSWNPLGPIQQVDGEYQTTINGLAGCDGCADYLIQIAPLHGKILGDPSGFVGVNLDAAFEPEFRLSTSVSTPDGFTFSIIGWDKSGYLSPDLTLPINHSGYTTTYYGPFIYTFTYSNTRGVKVSGPDSYGNFTVSGLQPGQKAKVTIARSWLSTIGLTVSGTALSKQDIDVSVK